MKSLRELEVLEESSEEAVERSSVQPTDCDFSCSNFSPAGPELSSAAFLSQGKLDDSSPFVNESDDDEVRLSIFLVMLLSTAFFFQCFCRSEQLKLSFLSPALSLVFLQA